MKFQDILHENSRIFKVFSVCKRLLHFLAKSSCSYFVFVLTTGALLSEQNLLESGNLSHILSD